MGIKQVVIDNDSLVDEWHDGDSQLTLREYLGMNHVQYSEFVKGGVGNVHKTGSYR